MENEARKTTGRGKALNRGLEMDCNWRMKNTEKVSIGGLEWKRLENGE